MDKIFSNRLVIRRMEKADLPMFSQWSVSPEAHGEYLTIHKFSLKECLEKFENDYFWNDNSKTFIIALRDGQAIGTLHYWKNIAKIVRAVVTVKITLKEVRGKGYGTEAQKILINYLFQREKFDVVDMYTDLDNFAEQRCLAKLGFELVESLNFDDHGISRLGNLYRLTKEKHNDLAIYKYHYE